MKPFNTKKKLSLNKQTISTISSSALTFVRGGRNDDPVTIVFTVCLECSEPAIACDPSDPPGSGSPKTCDPKCG